MQKQIKWGILATGGIASLFTCQIMRNGLFVQAVASRTAGKAEEFVKEVCEPHLKTSPNLPKAYSTYEELFEDPEVDVIYIATPHSDHHKWALKALEYGKNLLIEKSITRNSKEAKEIFNLANEKNLFVMEAMWTRYLPHICKVKELVDSGKIGKVKAIIADFGIAKEFDPKHRLFNPELAGGALLDLGIYPISFTHFILGVPQNITSKMKKAVTGVDETVSIIFEYADGVFANLFTSSTSASATTAVIVGELGRIEIATPFYRPSEFILKLNNCKPEVFDNFDSVDGFYREIEEKGIEGRNGMQFEAFEVERCLDLGLKESPSHSQKSTLEVMEILDSIRFEHNFKYPGE